MYQQVTIKTPPHLETAHAKPLRLHLKYSYEEIRPSATVKTINAPQEVIQGGGMFNSWAKANVEVRGVLTNRPGHSALR